MKKNDEVVLGRKFNGRIYFTAEEKKLIVEDYLSGTESKNAVYKRYTGYSIEHGKISDWIRKFGYEEKGKGKSNTFTPMSKKKVNNSSPVSMDSFENLQLKKRIAELEKQLKEAEMKAIAFSTMVDIAEKQFKVPIRKKFNTKP